MAETNLTILQGIDTVGAFRKLANASTEEASIVPWQTGLDLDMQRDSDTTSTKDGAVPTQGALETDFETDFINNTSAIADAMSDSIVDGDVLEGWVIYRKRLNAQGQAYAWYLRCTVSEDDNSNDSDDNSTREVSFNVNGTPKRGWVTLPASVQEAIDYVFRGLGKVTDDDETGQGVAWKDADAGTNVEASVAPKQ